MSWWLILVELAYALIVLFTCYRVIMDTRSSTKAMAYLLMIFLLPLVGIIIYFSIGVNYKKRQIYTKKIAKNDTVHQLVSQLIHNWNALAIWQNQGMASAQLAQFLFRVNKNPLTNHNRVEILRNGEEKFERVLAELATARSSIHIEYYIIDEGEMCNRLEQVLQQKAKEGVNVRVIYDDFGSKSIRKQTVDRWRSYGIAIFPFYQIKLIAFANRLNYRNHRKIIVIDGERGFTGGINWSDRYNNQLANNLYWRDTHLFLHGPAAASLQTVFLADWNFCSGMPIELSADLFAGIKTSPGDKFVQIAADGPDYPSPIILYSLLQTIHNAKSYIFATTPYYIPDESLQNALCLAASSGVDVRLLVPLESDSRIVNAAARSYFKELLLAGVKIYQYHNGFIHAKTLVVDDKLAIIGSANLDYRSFDLNFETNTLIYDEETAITLREQFESDLLDAKEIEPIAWYKRNKLRRFAEKIASLFSPLL